VCVCVCVSAFSSLFPRSRAVRVSNTPFLNARDRRIPNAKILFAAHARRPPSPPTLPLRSAVGLERRPTRSKRAYMINDDDLGAINIDTRHAWLRSVADAREPNLIYTRYEFGTSRFELRAEKRRIRRSTVYVSVRVSYVSRTIRNRRKPSHISETINPDPIDIRSTDNFLIKTDLLRKI